MPGGTTTSTSVFNMVLNTIGASGVMSTLTSVQNGINGVVISMNKATTAAHQGRVNSEMQAAAYEKLAASVARSQASLDLFRLKVEANSRVITEGRTASAQYQQSIDELNNRLHQQLSALDRLDPASKGYEGRLTQINAAIKDTTNAIANLTKQQNEINTAVDKAASKEQLYQTQLAAREARLKAQGLAMNELKKPLTAFESFIATLTQVYEGVDKVSRTFDRLTLTIERVERIWLKFKQITATVTGGAIGGSSTGGAGGVASTIEAAIAPEVALTQAVGATAQKFSLLGQAAAVALGTLVADAIRTAINLLTQLGQKMVEVGQASIGVAARFQELTLVAQLLGARAGMSTVQVDQAIKTIRSYGIEASEAAEVLAQFSRYELDMAQATDLARVAQDAAVLSGQNSSETLNNLIYGIITYNTRILRTAGLNVDMSNAFDAMAKKLGIATDQLSEAQKVQAALNAVIAEGAKITGVYETAMTTASKQIRSMPRLINDLALEIGTPFLGALSEGVAGINEFIKSLTKAFAQGGPLHQIVVGLGFVANDIVSTFRSMGESALVWGENLVNQFAQGMLNAIGSILSALTDIANIVSYWLSPGSPPKLLPDIGDWGQSAINEFFKGFSMGDFSLFAGIGDTIEKHLRSVLVREPGDKVGILNNIFGERQAVTSAIAELDKTGSVAEDTFQRIFAAMGGATKETQDYIRTAVALEAQNRKVSAAQKELDDVTKKYNDLLKPVQDSLQSITDAQADLAAEQQKTMLELVLKDPNATLAEKQRAKLEIDRLSGEEKQRALVAEAKKEIDTAQAKVDAEVAKQTALQNTLELQRSILAAEDSQVALMQEYYDLMKQIANESAAAGGGGGGGGGPKPPVTNPLGGGAFKPPKLAPIIEPQWLTDLKAKLAEAWNAIQGAFTNINKTLEPVWKAFGRLQQSWDDMVKDFQTYIPEIETWFGGLVAWTVSAFSISMPGSIDNLSEAIKNFQGIWDKNHAIILEVATRVWHFVVTVFLNTVYWITWSIMTITKLLNFDWVQAWNSFMDTIGGIQKGIESFAAFIGHQVDILSLLFSGSINIFKGYIWGFFTGDWIPFWDGLWQYATGLALLIEDVWRMLTGAINTIVLPFLGDLRKKWEDFYWDLNFKMFTFKEDIKQKWTDFKDAVNQIVTDWKTHLTELWNGIWEGIKEKSGAKIKESIQQFIDWLTGAGGVQSVISGQVDNFKKLGNNIIQGLIDGATAYAQNLIDAIVGPITNAIARAKALLGISSPSRVMAETIGKPMAQGIIMGLMGESGNIQRTLGGMLAGSIQMIGGPGTSALGSSYSSSQVTNFNYSPTYQGGAPATSDNFALMQAMVI